MLLAVPALFRTFACATIDLLQRSESVRVHRKILSAPVSGRSYTALQLDISAFRKGVSRLRDIRGYMFVLGVHLSRICFHVA